MENIYVIVIRPQLAQNNWRRHPVENFHISIFLRYGVSPEAFPLPRYPDVTFPAELVVSSEEDPVVREPDTVLAGLLQGGGEAEEDVAGVGAAGEVGGH